jgi:hypothetical protein
MLCGENQLTLHGSGRAKVVGAEFEVVCRRCILPLAIHALRIFRVKVTGSSQCVYMLSKNLVT